MTDPCDLVKKGIIATTVACSAAFAQAAAIVPVEIGTRLEQNAPVGAAAKIATDYFAKPTSNASLEEAKTKLLQLPSSEIRDASDAFHKINSTERDQLRDLGRLIVGNTPAEQVTQKISGLKSPELRDGLIELQRKIEQDKRGSDKGAPYLDMQAGVKKLDEAAFNRETSFKTIVGEAAREKITIEMNLRRKGLGS